MRCSLGALCLQTYHGHYRHLLLPVRVTGFQHFLSKLDNFRPQTLRGFIFCMDYIDLQSNSPKLLNNLREKVQYSWNITKCLTIVLDYTWSTFNLDTRTVHKTSCMTFLWLNDLFGTTTTHAHKFLFHHVVLVILSTWNHNFNLSR